MSLKTAAFLTALGMFFTPGLFAEETQHVQDGVNYVVERPESDLDMQEIPSEDLTPETPVSQPSTPAVN